MAAHFFADRMRHALQQTPLQDKRRLAHIARSLMRLLVRLCLLQAQHRPQLLLLLVQAQPLGKVLALPTSELAWNQKS